MNTFLAALAASPPGWPFPFSPMAAVTLALAVIYAASLLTPSQDQE